MARPRKVKMKPELVGTPAADCVKTMRSQARIACLFCGAESDETQISLGIVIASCREHGYAGTLLASEMYCEVFSGEGNADVLRELDAICPHWKHKLDEYVRMIYRITDA